MSNSNRVVGITFYTKGKAEVEVNFPNGHTVCAFCPFLISEKALGRGRCKLNRDEVIPLDFVDSGRSPNCPLTIEETQQNVDLPFLPRIEE